MHNLVRRRGAATLWIVIGIAALIGAVVIGLIYWSRGGSPTVTGAAYQGALGSPKPFPATVAGEIVVTYHVDTRQETRPSGAGAGFPPTRATPWVGADGVDVTFTLSTGAAKFDTGTKREVVETDSNGDASVTIVAAAGGSDVLTFAFTVNGKTSVDSVTNTFTITP